MKSNGKKIDGWIERWENKMGCPDDVLVPCPKCGKIERFQSKGSFDQSCRTFKLKNCPEDVFSDINRHSPYKCWKCKTKFYVSEKTRKSKIFKGKFVD